jgi:hypothetical protein
MKRKELTSLSATLGISRSVIEDMENVEIQEYIMANKLQELLKVMSQRQLSRQKSPSPVRPRSPSPVRPRSPSPVRPRSPSPVRPRSPSPVRPKYREVDLRGLRVSDLKELCKAEGLKKWKDKTPSRMLKQDFIDYLLYIGGGDAGVVVDHKPIQQLVISDGGKKGSPKIVVSPKQVKIQDSPLKPQSRAELLLLKVPESGFRVKEV